MTSSNLCACLSEREREDNILICPDLQALFKAALSVLWAFDALDRGKHHGDDIAGLRISG
jgi:hypothetical protein